MSRSIITNPTCGFFWSLEYFRLTKSQVHNLARRWRICVNNTAETPALLVCVDRERYVQIPGTFTHPPGDHGI